VRFGFAIQSYSVTHTAGHDDVMIADWSSIPALAVPSFAGRGCSGGENLPFGPRPIIKAMKWLGWLLRWNNVNIIFLILRKYITVLCKPLCIENYCHDINIYNFSKYTEWFTKHAHLFFLQQCSYSKQNFWNF